MIYDLFVGCDKEWYSWHFLDMVKIVNDDCIYAKIIRFVKNKKSFITNSLEDLLKNIGDENKACEVIKVAKVWVGLFLAKSRVWFSHAKLPSLF
jgi:RNA processing factor Prp31